MSMDSLKDLYIDELKDLYNAENQLLKALPKMAKKASAPELKRAFQDHLAQTQGHVDRLEKIFKGLGEKPTGKTCKAMKGWSRKARKSSTKMATSPCSMPRSSAPRNASSITRSPDTAWSAPSLRCWVKTTLWDCMQRTLNEEAEADKKLTKLAESVINVEASEAEAERSRKPKRRNLATAGKQSGR